MELGVGKISQTPNNFDSVYNMDNSQNVDQLN